MSKIVIYGNRAQAQLSYEYLKDRGNDVVAFCMKQEFIQEKTLFDIPVVDYECLVDSFPPSEYHLFIAIGPHDNNRIREEVYLDAKGKGYSLVNCICSKATVWPDLECGDNVLIDISTTIHPFVKVGNNTSFIISIIGHHCVIGNNVFISGAILGGTVTVEDNAFIGMNAVIREGVRIGKGSIIGAGCVILEDVEPYSVYSAPACRKRKVDARKIKLFKD